MNRAILSVLALALSAAAASAQTTINRFVIACGGGASSGTVSGSATSITGTIGQHDAGPTGGPMSGTLATGGTVTLAGGFWPATTVPPPSCPPDINGDGVLNPDDLSDYIGCYFSEPPCTYADYNHDGVVNPDDLSDYIGAFFDGCP